MPKTFDKPCSTSLQSAALEIRERELTYYTNNCLAISTSSALLAGFAWDAPTEVRVFSSQALATAFFRLPALRHTLLTTILPPGESRWFVLAFEFTT